jgi:hypothetical protein
MSPAKDPLGPCGCGRKPTRRQRTLERLEKWGAAGVASYGLLNTLYYGITIPLAFFFVAKVSPGMGLQQATVKLSEVIFSSWVLSQPLKVPRAVGCAPFTPLAPLPHYATHAMNTTRATHAVLPVAPALLYSLCFILCPGPRFALHLAVSAQPSRAGLRIFGHQSDVPLTPSKHS